MNQKNNKKTTKNEEYDKEYKEGRLTAEQRAFFEENGYIILSKVIEPELAQQAYDEVWEVVSFHGASRSDPQTWRNEKIFNKKGFLDVYPIFNLNSTWQMRQNVHLYSLFAELYKEKKLYVSIDRCSLKRPGKIDKTNLRDLQSNEWLHVDVNPWHIPNPVRLQGIVALTDTCKEQGTLFLIPKFHKEIDEWAIKHKNSHYIAPELNMLFFDANLMWKRAIPIVLDQGDVLIFDSRIIHGSGPNSTSLFRSFAYISYEPFVYNEQVVYERIKAYETGHPIGYSSPRKKPISHPFPYSPPPLSSLGKKLLGLTSWDCNEDDDEDDDDNIAIIINNNNNNNNN